MTLEESDVFSILAATSLVYWLCVIIIIISSSSSSNNNNNSSNYNGNRYSVCVMSTRLVDEDK